MCPLKGTLSHKSYDISLDTCIGSVFFFFQGSECKLSTGSNNCERSFTLRLSVLEFSSETVATFEVASVNYYVSSLLSLITRELIVTNLITDYRTTTTTTVKLSTLYLKMSYISVKQTNIKLIN